MYGALKEVGSEPSPELFSADGKRTEMKWQGVQDSRCSNGKTLGGNLRRPGRPRISWIQQIADGTPFGIIFVPNSPRYVVVGTPG